VQPLRKSHSVAVSRAGEVVSLAVAEGRTCGDQGEQYGRVLHLAENFGAKEIPIRAGFHELLERDWISGGCESEILAQHRADLIFLAGDAVTEQMTDHGAKEKPPQIERAIKAMQAKGFDDEAAVGQRFCGLGDGCASLRSRHAQGVALENSDAHAAKLSLVLRTHGNRSGEGVAGVRPEHHFEEGVHVRDGACHWTDNADPGKSAGAW